jgi:hypothetical protein
MTKKHFIALADAIRGMITHDDGSSLEYAEVVETLADFCQEQNPNFNRERWLGYIAGTNGKNGGKSQRRAASKAVVVSGRNFFVGREYFEAPETRAKHPK